MMISAAIVCLNETNKLEQCLESISDFVQEIVVLDLGSSDNSKEVARKYHAKVFEHKFVSFVEEVRNYSISKTKGDWILILDPDETIPTGLKNELKKVAKQDNFTAVNIPRKNIFFGRWIAHTNWWPDKHIRFFKKGKVKWSEVIHNYPVVEGKILNLEAKEDLAIWHFGYQTLSEFVDRQNRYSSIAAQNLFNSGKRFSWRNFFWNPTREFLVRFIKHAGFLDGFYGFALTYLMMIYQLQVMVKLWELENKR